MTQWLRLLIFALILISFLRRIFKAQSRTKLPTTPGRPAQGRKNDFRDVPPPPENPNMG
jgi:hypothetical protein